jgi:hypothetical protein
MFEIREPCFSLNVNNVCTVTLVVRGGPWSVVREPLISKSPGDGPLAVVNRAIPIPLAGGPWSVARGARSNR